MNSVRCIIFALDTLEWARRLDRLLPSLERIASVCAAHAGPQTIGAAVICG